MPGCGSGAVVCSCSLLFGCHLGRRQAETPITPLSKFSRPALTMTEREHKARRIAFKALVGGDRDFLRELIRTTLQEVLEAEMTEALGAAIRALAVETHENWLEQHRYLN